jgi:hypothetical protein
MVPQQRDIKHPRCMMIGSGGPAVEPVDVQFELGSALNE